MTGNTDPDQWITGGSRTVDEMFRLRLGMTFYSDEDFAGLVAERKVGSGGAAGGGE